MAYPKGVPNSRCKVCSHENLTQIELLIAAGASHTAVGGKWRLTKHAIGRHWKNHVSPERLAMLQIGRVHKAALLARIEQEASSIIDMHKITRSALLDFLSTCVTARDASTGASVAAQLTNVNNSIGRITGELANSPLISHQSINFYSHPVYHELESVLVAALKPYPEAQQAVLQAIRAMEDRHAEAQDQPKRIEAPSIIKAELMS